MNLGQMGEEIAANYLQNKGYRVVERNFRCKSGEIDIIAYRDKTLVFIEVKTRTNFTYGLPCEAVNQKKQRHIKSAAVQYGMRYSVGYPNQRIDVVEVLCIGEKAYIRHTENAF